MTGTAIVTGAAGAVGAAIVGMLQDAGMGVAGFDREVEPLSDVSLQVDPSSRQAMTAAVAEVEMALGPVTAFVSAPEHYLSTAFTDVTDDEASEMLRAHLGSFFVGARAVLPQMIDRGDGAIVAIVSAAAIGGGDLESHYASATGAVLGAVRSLAAEVAPRGVRVNAVAPGPVDTEILPVDSRWRTPDNLAALPTRTLPTPYDVALCVELLVHGGSFMTGEVLHPNSGAVI